MRKAFSLMEMLVVVATLPVFLVLVSRVFMVLNRDIPRSTQLVIEQTTVQQALDRIRQDVDEARGLPRSYGGWSSDERTLVIEKADGGVLYQVKDGKVTRALIGPGGGPLEQAWEWSLPDASIRWGLWGQGVHAYAVEVQTHLIHRLSTRGQERLANSHVFFLVGAPKEVTP